MSDAFVLLLRLSTVYRFLLALVLLIMAATLGSCQSGPRAVRLGQDECAHCRMTVVKPGFAAELVTSKGRQYIFDDLICLAGFLREHPEVASRNPSLLVADFMEPAKWLPIQAAHLVRSPEFHTPMNGQVAAFATESAAQGASGQLRQGGQMLTWNDVSQLQVR
jgi:copper chaperone NosL